MFASRCSRHQLEQDLARDCEGCRSSIRLRSRSPPTSIFAIYIVRPGFDSAGQSQSRPPLISTSVPFDEFFRLPTPSACLSSLRITGVPTQLFGKHRHTVAQHSAISTLAQPRCFYSTSSSCAYPLPSSHHSHLDVDSTIPRTLVKTLITPRAYSTQSGRHSTPESCAFSISSKLSVCATVTT